MGAQSLATEIHKTILASGHTSFPCLRGWQHFPFFCGDSVGVLKILHETHIIFSWKMFMGITVRGKGASFAHESPFRSPTACGLPALIGVAGATCHH